MTSESMEIAEMVDQFGDEERALMRETIMEIASVYRSIEEGRPVQLGFVYSVPGSNLIVGPWKGSRMTRKPPKKAHRKPPAEPGAAADATTPAAE
jgi:hypothetical protein